MTISYRPHPGQSHEWSHPIPQLAGGRTCRVCGQLYPGLPAGPGSSPEEVALDLEAKVIAEPYRACPRFDTCSVNLCPFDPLIRVRTVDPEDRETKCPLSRRVRRGLFAALPSLAQARLPFGGLYEREFTRGKTWARVLAGLSEEQRARRVAGRAAGLAAIKRARDERLSDAATPEPVDSLSEGSTGSKTRSNGGETA